MKKIILSILITSLFLSIFGYIVYKNYTSKYEYIDFNKSVNIENKQTKDVVSIGMISVSGGSKGYVVEKELANYIGEKLNKNVKFIQRKSYKEINTLLKNNEIDIAFLSTGAYVLYDEKEKLELLARPNRGKGFYHPVVIVRNDSQINELQDLENQDFAFVDTYSYSGYLYLSNYLLEQGSTVDKFFQGKYYFTYSHEQSIRQVVNGNVKGAVVDDWTLQYLEKNNPEIANEVRVIKIFDEVATGPVVSKVDYEDKDKIKDILFNLSNDEQVKDILEKLQIEGYEDTKKEDYPTILKGENNAS